MNNWLFLIVGLFFGIFTDYFWAFIVNWPKHKGKIPVTVHIFNHHIHHSTLGLIFILIGLLTDFYSSIIIGFGFGIIISHTIRTKELMFIEKVKRREK